MSESKIQADIRLTASAKGYTLWRNNQGAYMDAKGHWVKYGVCNPGGSDLIGYKPTIITQDMVGQTLAVFTAIEVKTPTGKLKSAQKDFLDAVKRSGGIAIVARSESDLD